MPFAGGVSRSTPFFLLDVSLALPLCEFISTQQSMVAFGLPAALNIGAALTLM